MKAIFFDLDGTLFDTRHDLAATVNHTRRDLGLAELSAETVITFVGQGARYLLTHAIPETDRPFEDLWTIFKSHYAEHCCETLTPYPGVLETLEAFRRAGWRLGVNTNKPNFATHAIFEKFGLKDLFGAAVVAGGDGFPLKPDAGSLQACAERLGHTLTPDDWMVGDSWTDLKCAANAGVKGAFCAFGFGQLADAPYDLWLDRFDKLQDLIRE